MLQLPYLPEIMMRAEDYKSLEQAYFSKATVSNQRSVLSLINCMYTVGYKKPAKCS